MLEVEDWDIVDYRKNPRERANLLNVLFFGYTFPTFKIGRIRDFDDADIYEVLKAHRSEILGNKLEKEWLKETKKKKKKQSLMNALMRMFWKRFFLFSCLMIYLEALRVGQVVCLYYLLVYYSAGNAVIDTKTEANYLAAGIALFSIAFTLSVHPYYQGVQHLAMKMRIACCSLIYRKCLKLSKKGTDTATIGYIVNLLSNDVNRFDYAIEHVPHLPIVPLGIISLTVFSWLLIGPTSAVSIGILVSCIPIQIWLATEFSKIRSKTALRTDERVRIMNEIICGVQVIKMYAWEQQFVQLVSSARRFEVNQIHKACNIKAFLLSMGLFMPRLAVFCSILVYVVCAEKDMLTPEYVFTLVATANFLRHSLTIMVSTLVPNFAELLVSIKRINKFLQYNEMVEDHKVVDTSKNGVWIKNGTASWTKTAVLKNINLSIEAPSLVAIVGGVGSGKSSLLQVILKELPLDSGTLEVKGTISYSSQEAWLFSGSIRDNILFGSKFNKSRYKKVIDVCSLRRDFIILPYGDSTLIGESGTTLSGGQKARVNLARAIYKDSDIYLLDDPLSAVDVNVAKQLFNKCIVQFLQNKICILVTHQIQYLHSVKHIIMLQLGKIEMQGNLRDLQMNAPSFINIFQEEDTDEQTLIDTVILRNSLSLPTIVSTIRQRKMSKEAFARGRVSLNVYLAYLKSGGSWFTISSVIVIFIFTQVIITVADYFLSFWVTSGGELDSLFYVYIGLLTAVVVVTISRTIYFYAFCMKASIRLHDTMFDNIIKVPMSYFNKNPTGRILNRFSKDMGIIDDVLPLVACDSCQIILQMLGILFLTAILCPILIVPLIVVLLVAVWFMSVYARTSRGVKRLEGTTRSPVFTHTNSTLHGLSTIRAFNASKLSIDIFDSYQDVHSTVFYIFLSISRAFGYYLDLLCCCYISFVCLLFVVLDYGIDGGTVGLAITQTLGLTVMFQWGMRQLTEVQNQLTSVERVYEYTQLEKERPTLRAVEPEHGWPRKGTIKFQSVYLQYDKFAGFVLKNLSFEISHKEKIGVVGRTGAGKSSLILSLFQLAPTEGKILIDDVDTRTVPFATLRSNISIIPQEPVLFAETLRKNLDPFDRYEDIDVWQVLEDVEMKEVVLNYPLGLSTMIYEGGANFSVGERQLLCLARAILRNKKILVLDEATANVDSRTDRLIQRTIRDHFDKCTVLTIAHRLYTIADSDKVLVLDAGTLIEFDHPHILLQNTSSLFSQMVEVTGEQMARDLRAIALQNYKQNVSNQSLEKRVSFKDTSDEVENEVINHSDEEQDEEEL